MDTTPPEPAHGAGASHTSRVEPSGVPNLDQILGGGIPRGALILILGMPGSGKTMLAAQLAFAAGQRGRSVLILTSLSESTDKLIGHLRTYRFFDEELIGETLHFLALGSFLDEGRDSVADRVVAEARRQQVSMVVLDGFSGIQGALHDVQTARLLLYELSTRLGMLGIATIITTQAAPHEPSLFPEGTTADIVLGMHYMLDGVRERRAIEAIKVRGAAPVVGLHGLRLSAEGVRVYPRLETRVLSEGTEGQGREATDRTPVEQDERASFDLPALDALLGGGVTTQTPTLVLGSPGAGKTLLGLQFALAGVRAGERAVFLGFHETHNELLRKTAPFIFGAALRDALAPGGGITLLRQPPVERDPDVLADALLREIDASGARRLVIDSIPVLERTVVETSGARRLPNYLGALIEALRVRGITALLIRENDSLTTTSLIAESEWVSLLAANVLWLQQVTFRDRLYRVLSVPKMRYSAHDVTLREYTITVPDGMQVLGTFESEAGVLTGIARQQGQPSRTTDESAEDMVRAT